MILNSTHLTVPAMGFVGSGHKLPIHIAPRAPDLGPRQTIPAETAYHPLQQARK